MIEHLTDDQRKQLELAEKLFRTAGRSKGEAEQYTAKAMAILESLNMDMSVLEQGGTEKAKRSDAKFVSGRYHYQRDIWDAVADLHFCRCWTQYNWDKDKISPYAIKTKGTAYAKANRGGWRHEMRLVGRTVNVIATKNMATYIEATIERMLKDHMAETMRRDLHNSVYCISFREGMASAIITSVYKRREHLLAEEQRKAKEQADRAAAAAAAGAGGKAVAISLADVAEQERIANYDFMYGEGAWAKVEAERLERAAKRKAAQDEYTRWAAENPEEARKQEAERKAEEEKREAKRRRGGGTGSRGGTSHLKNTDWDAYTAGERVGRTVGIDPQAEGRAKPAGLL